MFKNLTTIIAGTLIALATGPAFAQSQNLRGDINRILEALETLQDVVVGSQGLLEPKTIFVSSTPQSNGDLGGLDGADVICQDLADDVAGGSIVPAGDYVALLSTDDVNAASRVPPNVGSFVRPDGVPVAANFASLFATTFENGDNDLINDVSVDEKGVDVGAVEVWTGTLESGIGTGNSNCGNWEKEGTFPSDTFAGRTGSTVETNKQWISAISGRDCRSTTRHLYCVQLCSGVGCSGG